VPLCASIIDVIVFIGPEPPNSNGLPASAGYIVPGRNILGKFVIYSSLNTANADMFNLKTSAES
jgi:hypothetical protein